MAVFRVGECRDRVLYNDVQNVVVMNTSAFYLKKKSLMCLANLHAVCFLHCGILLYSKMRQSLTIYIFISLHVSGVHS